MEPDELKQRTKTFGLGIISLVNALPSTTVAQVLGKQLLRCATSVGANYRSACRARSRADFISKIGIVEEESDECVYWLELLAESKIGPSLRINAFIKEAGELTAIFTASGRTARQNPQSAIRNPKLHSARGAILLGALIMLFTISLIGATLAALFTSVSLIAEVELSRTQALYLAEAGIAQTIHQVRQAGLSGKDVLREVPLTALGEGQYEATHDSSAGLITATGISHGVRRTIQVKYHLF
jgi:four helix bundle protein